MQMKSKDNLLQIQHLCISSFTYLSFTELGVPLVVTLSQLILISSEVCQDTVVCSLGITANCKCYI